MKSSVLVKYRLPLKERAPPVPDFSESHKKPDHLDIEKQMANFFADLNKKGGFEIIQGPQSFGSCESAKNSPSDNSQTQSQLQSVQQQLTQQQQTTAANQSSSDKVKKSFDKTKMDKINQMFAEKKKETISKGDLNDKLKNLFQKNGLSASVVPSNSTSLTDSSTAATATANINNQKKTLASSNNPNNNSSDTLSKNNTRVSGSDSQVLVLNKKEEYDPARPNDYEQLKRQQIKLKQEQDKLKTEQSEKNKQEVPPEAENEEQMDEEDDLFKPSLGLGNKNTYPPPIQQMEIEKDTGDLYSKSEYESSEEKAYKMMSKQGFKLGQGLGKQSQGIVAPIIAQKISDTSAIITQSTMDLSTVLSQEVILKRYFQQKNMSPTKVICLINLISPFEIDETLEEEVTEECFQFGNVVNLKIYVMASEDCEDAVRIFVKLEESMNAFTSLDGRIFNGRTVRSSFYEEDKFEVNQLADKLF